MSQQLTTLKARIARTKDITKRINLQWKLIFAIDDVAEGERQALAMLDYYTSISHPLGIASAQVIIGRLYCMKGAVTESIAFFNKAKQLDDLTIQAHSIVGLGIAQRLLGNNRESIRMTQHALGLIEGIAGYDKLCLTALNSMALAYMHLSDYKTALKFGQMCIEKARLSNDPSLEGTPLIVVGTTLCYLEKYPEAQASMERALEINRRREEESAVAACLQNLCNLFSTQKNWKQALTFALECFEIADRIEYLQQKMRAALSLAEVYLQLGDFPAAENFILLSQELGEKAESKYTCTRAHLLLGDLRFQKQCIAEAYQLYLKALSVLQDQEEILDRISLLQKLSDLCESQKMFEEALLYQKQLAEAKSFFEKQQNDREIVLMQVHIDTALLEQERESYKVKAMQAINAFEEQTRELNDLSSELDHRRQLLLSLREEIAAVERDVSSSKLQSIRKKIDAEIISERRASQIDAILETLQPDFGKQLSQRYPELSKTEVKICLLLKSGLKTPDLSRLLHMSERTVETHRLNIRRKMGLKGKVNLAEVLQQIQ